MTDIEVLEREKQCVQRKSVTNCSDCAHCDLLMDDAVILTAYDHAISALRQQEQERNDWICTLQCTALMDEGMCSHGGLCCLYESQRVIEENAPLTLEELRQMDGEPVWVVCDEEAVKNTPGLEPLAFWALVEVCEESIFLTNNFGGRTEYAADVELEEDGITAYRRKPEEDAK